MHKRYGIGDYKMEDMNKESLFPKVKKSIENFLYEEEGHISRNKVVTLGTLVLVMALLMSDEVFATHSSGGGGHSSHSSHESHSSHVSSSTHNSHSNATTEHSNHGSHSNHSNHVSHNNASHYDNPTGTVSGSHGNASLDTKISGVKIDEINDINTPLANNIPNVSGEFNSVISIPPNTQE